MSCTCLLMQAFETNQNYNWGLWMICSLCGHRYLSIEEWCPHCNVQITGDQHMLYFTARHEPEKDDGD